MTFPTKDGPLLMSGASGRNPDLRMKDPVPTSARGNFFFWHHQIRAAARGIELLNSRSQPEDMVMLQVAR